MREPKFKVGQEVWFVHTKTEEAKEVCKDCLGSAYLTVILGDKSQVTIKCEGCNRGWAGSNGCNNYWKHTELPKKTMITRMEYNQDGEWEYGSHDSYGHLEEDIFLTEEGCRERAVIVAEERTQKEIERIQYKYNNQRTWAWNASYHRKQIRQAKSTIEWSTKCLEVAKAKAKKQEEADDEQEG